MIENHGHAEAEAASGNVGSGVKGGVGMRFGSLVIVERCGSNRYGQAMWLCRCDCGGTKITTGARLRSGKCASCGCSRKGTKNAMRHGMSLSPEYCSWVAMKERCNRERSRSYADYGGRGITVCERWNCSFESFLADVGKRPGAGFTLERLDNNGNYEPENVIWADASAQGSNKRNNVRLEMGGVSMTVAEWSRKTGIHDATIRTRIRSGRDPLGPVTSSGRFGER